MTLSKWPGNLAWQYSWALAAVLIFCGYAFPATALSITGDSRLPAGNQSPIQYSYTPPDNDDFGGSGSCTLKFGSLASGTLDDKDRWSDFSPVQKIVWYKSGGQFQIQLFTSGVKFEPGNYTLTNDQNPSTMAAAQITLNLSAADLLGGGADFVANCTNIPLPEINVTGGIPPVSISAGLSDPVNETNGTFFGNVDVSGGTVSRTFTIHNTGPGALNLTGTPLVDLGGSGSADFTVTTPPVSPVVSSGSTSFTIEFNPNTTGKRNASISIQNNDTDESNYQILIRGIGTAPPKFSKSFAPGTIQVGGTSTLTFTIDNTANALDGATALAFTDTLPAAISVAAPLVTSNACGGSLIATAGSGTISFSGGSVGAAGSCTIDVDVTSSTAGLHDNVSGDLTSSLGSSGTAFDTFTVVSAPTITKEFTDDPVTPGDMVTLEFTIDNPNPVEDATDLAFTDDLDAALTGLVVASAPVNTCGGMNSGDTGFFDYSGGSVLANSSCTISLVLNVPPAAPSGSHTNTTSDLSATVGGLSVTESPASDDLVVRSTPPLFTKEFAPDTIQVGGTSTLTFTIDNTDKGGSPVEDLAFTDTLPTGVVIANPTEASSTCDGMGDATAGASSFTFGGGMVGTGVSCTVQFNVTSMTVGSHDNESGDLTSSLGNSGTASDTLNVVSVEEPIFTKEFTDDPVLPGGQVTLVFTIQNTDPVNDATVLVFTDDLTAGLKIQSMPTNTCGGINDNGGNSGFIDYFGGSIPANSNCKVSFILDVDSTIAIGSYPNTTTDLQVTLAGLRVRSDPASDTLIVGAPGAKAEETQERIYSFLFNRAGHFLNNQWSAIDLFTGANTNGAGPLGNLALNGNSESLNLAFSTSRSKILTAMGKGPTSQGLSVPSTSSTVGTLNNTLMMSFAPATGATETEEQLTGLDNSNVLDPETGEEAAREVEAAVNEQTATSTYQADRTGTWDIWTEIYGSMSNSGASESTLWVGYVGTHVFVSPDMLVGFMGQIDWAEETNSTLASNADGMGWMIGPYVAGRMPGQDLYYEARAVWGRSDNNISPIGTYTDGFETKRWMLLGKLEGSFEMGNLTIKPAARVAWYEETQESYTDTNAVFIPSQTISLGEFRFGPEFVWAILLEDDTLFQPNFGVSGVFNFGIRNNFASQGVALGDNDLRARVKAGFSATNPMGMILKVSGFYDGIGTNNYYSYGGNVRLTVPLN